MSCCANTEPPKNIELNQYHPYQPQQMQWRTPYDQAMMLRYNPMTQGGRGNRAEFYSPSASSPPAPAYRTSYDKAFLAKYDSMASGPRSNRAGF